MANLYELSEEFRQLYDMADDPEIDVDTWFDSIDGVEYELKDKLEGYCRVIAMLEADVKGFKSEEERLYQRRKTAENNVTRMKARMQESLENAGLDSLKTEFHTCRIQNNPASVFIPDESRVPLQFQIPQPNKIDKTKIKEWLKEGNECDFAELTTTRSIRIR